MTYLNTAYAIDIRHNQLLGRSIDQRPEIITQRGRIGDFEVDMVVEPRGQGKAVLLTLVDRKSRFFWDYLLEDWSVVAVNEALSKFIIAEHGLTVARGTEFSGFDILETQYGIRTYYCHAYSSAERGSNDRALFLP